MKSRISLPLLLIAVLATTACQGLRIKSRNDVAGAPDLTVSQFAPEEAENCTGLGQARCAYLTIALKSVQQVCAEKVASRATSLGANYVWVNEPKQTVGGFKTRRPYANFYKCTALISK